MGASGRTVARTSWVVGGAVAVVVLARLPFLRLPAWPDEAGFLVVGGHWRLGEPTGPGGLYGAYWVDRPPLLITLFGIADRLGGLVPLRLLGALAAALTVAGVAWIASTAAGPLTGRRAGAWAAVIGAALLCSPYHWAFEVDGELLALPAVALGIAVVASRPTSRAGSASVRAALGGAAALAAVLIKQNFADVFVFAVVYFTMSALSRASGVSSVARRAGAFLVGALGLGLLVAAWTVVHGTSLGGVFYAMYPFRLQVRSPISWHRVADLGLAATLSGLSVLVVCVVVAGLRRAHQDPRVVALLVVLAFDVFSLFGGGNFWLHYLLQMIVPVAALGGILVARGSWVVLVAAALVPLSVVGWVVLLLSPPQTAEEQVGRAIAKVSRPGDSVVTVWGRANVDYAAGLPSPYPYLWSVPAQKRDRHAAGLKRLLASDRAPTWIVTWEIASRPAAPGSLRWDIAQYYRRAARLCGRAVYLRRGVSRRTPAAAPRAAATHASRCRSVTALPAPLPALSHS